MRDIEMIRTNPKGNDYIVADLHGNVEALKNILAIMKEGDALFFLGDIVDKGKDSLATFQLIQRAQKEGKVIHAVLGNHEAFCLRSIAIMEDYFRKGKLAEAITIPELAFHLETNGGLWLFELFGNELQNKSIAMVSICSLKGPPICTL